MFDGFGFAPWEGSDFVKGDAACTGSNGKDLVVGYEMEIEYASRVWKPFDESPTQVVREELLSFNDMGYEIFRKCKFHAYNFLSRMLKRLRQPSRSWGFGGDDGSSLSSSF